MRIIQLRVDNHVFKLLNDDKIKHKIPNWEEYIIQLFDSKKMRLK